MGARDQIMETNQEALHTEVFNAFILPSFLPLSLLPPHLSRAGMVPEAVEVKQGQGRRALACLPVEIENKKIEKW